MTDKIVDKNGDMIRWAKKKAGIPSIPTITLDWEQCGAIAKYYEFNTLVFMLDKKNMMKKLKGTRNKTIRKRLNMLKDKLNKLASEARDIL